MLVCNVSLRPPRTGIVADIAEAAEAVDATATGQVVFATLVDDPASVGDMVDAYLGEIMVEAASADDIVDGSIPATYAADITETTTAADTPDGTVVASFIGATFDPATVTDTALSNGNLTATHTTANANSGARCSLSYKTAGKFYFEIKLVKSTGGFDGMGLIAAATSYNNFGISATSSVRVTRAGVIGSNGSPTGKSVGSFAVNDVLGIAVDLTAHLVWCRRNTGSWNGDGSDPVTATGGLTAPSVGLAPGVCFVGTGTAINDAYTGNFGPSGFTGTVPSGFTAGWPA